MAHETFFDIMLTAATASTFGKVLCVTVAVALGLLVWGFVGSFISFTTNQARNLWKLYTQRETLDLGELHPFTRSILENRCPELARLKSLAQKLRVQESPATRKQARGILRNIEATLELYEENTSIRKQVLSSLQSVKI